MRTTKDFSTPSFTIWYNFTFYTFIWRDDAINHQFNTEINFTNFCQICKKTSLFSFLIRIINYFIFSLVFAFAIKYVELLYVLF